MTEAQATEVQVTDNEAFNALEQELGTFLRRARAMSAEMGREVHPDLDPEAYGLLAGIHDYSWARASELALHFGLGKATVSRQLKVLAELGLIERRPDPGDGRAHVLALTEEGRQRLENARNARQKRWHLVLGTWPIEDVRLMAGMLARFNRLCDGGG
ncbi:MarR family transcriptional regulator [Actinomadura sp. DC4]|uniref:MarR family winged helix-turn-helix transcriptional regulator n=1 Tax=Actinomadura sp. DC4 TaxID=3055069 RepID=UPI0025AF735C|nr:MarR family transcriptional regulator [Actinomadura sp. DC4]MDN3352112.1 MarR family transcriptional regulator [Actinomadura sp. DC4]